jgi:hypothetical protein
MKTGLVALALICFSAQGCMTTVELPLEPLESQAQMQPLDVTAGAVLEVEPGLGCAAPDGPYGVESGRTLEPFTLSTCDGSNYAFYGPDFCAARFTLINIAAGWCGPSIQQTTVFEEQYTDRYGHLGLRVIQIIVQTEAYGAPDEAYCTGWVSTYGLSNIELIDPAQITGSFFPDGALPASIIVDDRGVILHRFHGYYGIRGDLAEAVDALFAYDGL